jgi:hypothetical protein
MYGPALLVLASGKMAKATPQYLLLVAGFFVSAEQLGIATTEPGAG